MYAISTLQRTQLIPAYHVRDLSQCYMAVRPRLLRKYSCIKQNAATTYRPCKKCPLTNAQHMPHTQIRDVQTFHRHHWLLGSRNLPKAPVACFSPDGRHPWTPTTHQPHQTTLFYRLCNVFQQFVSKSSQIAALLSPRMKKDQPASFTTLNSEELYAMVSLRITLMSLPILGLSYSDEHMTLAADACNV